MRRSVLNALPLLLIVCSIAIVIAARPHVVVRSSEDPADIIDSADVLTEIGLDNRNDLSGMSASELERMIVDGSSFSDIRVRRRFPNRFLITVGRREPLLYLAYRDAENVARVAYISRHGVLSDASPAIRFAPAPILGGLSYRAIDEGARIPRAYIPLLDSLSMLKRQMPEVYAGISEVVVINKSQTEYEVLLHTAFAPVPIVSGVPISLVDLETALIAVSHLSIVDPSTGATHISIRGIAPVVRYDEI